MLSDNAFTSAQVHLQFNFILGFVGGKRGPHSAVALLAPPAVPSIASAPLAHLLLEPEPEVKCGVFLTQAAGVVILVLQDPFLQYPPPGTTM